MEEPLFTPVKASTIKNKKGRFSEPSPELITSDLWPNITAFPSFSIAIIAPRNYSRGSTECSTPTKNTLRNSESRFSRVICWIYPKNSTKKTSKLASSTLLVWPKLISGWRWRSELRAAKKTESITSNVKAESLYTKPEQVWNVYKALSDIGPMFSIAAAFGYDNNNNSHRLI